MRWRAWVRLVCCLLLAAATTHAQSSSFDLKTALALAETDNLELRAARQQRAITLAGLKIAGAIPNPIISFSAARDTPHESIVWDQPIELGGKRGKRLTVAREEQKATEIDIAALSRQIRQRTREAFYRGLWSRAQSEQAKAALDLATHIRDTVQLRFEAGDVAQLEVIQAEVELARIEADYEVAVQAQKIADAQLAALVNRPLDAPWDLQGRLGDVPGPQSLPGLTDAALRSNSGVQRTTQELQLEQRRLALAKSQRIPNLDLQAGVDLNSPNEFNAGPRGQIGIALPLFYRGQGEVAQSSARLEFLRLSLQAQKTDASAQVAASYFDYGAKAHQAEQYGQKIVPQSVRLEEMAEDSYRSGRSSLLILIDAQRKLNETRKAYVDTLFAVQSSFAALEAVVGEPLD
jgi:cobalt-zinc-cadmium efflux system outer membrane protein